MVLESIPLPSGVRRTVGMLLDAVRRGLLHFHGRGDHANAGAGERFTLLNQLSRILRFALLIAATWVELPPARARTPRPALRTRVVRLARPAFRLFPRYAIRYDDTPRAPQPAAFARAERDRFLVAQRKLEALARAYVDPLPLIRRMARRLPTQLMVIGWRPPRRPPPTDRRPYWEELIEGWREAWHQLRAWRERRRADMAASAPA
jgi:hypothetical protein